MPFKTIPNFNNLNISNVKRYQNPSSNPFNRSNNFQIPRYAQPAPFNTYKSNLSSSIRKPPYQAQNLALPAPTPMDISQQSKINRASSNNNPQPTFFSRELFKQELATQLDFPHQLYLDRSDYSDSNYFDQNFYESNNCDNQFQHNETQLDVTANHNSQQQIPEISEVRISRSEPNLENFVNTTTLPYIEVHFPERTFKFLIDTGSSVCFIDPSIINKDLTFIGTKEKLFTFGGSHEVELQITLPLFDEFNANNQNFNWYVYSFHQYFDGLIGRDLLKFIKAKIDLSKSGSITTPFCKIPIKEKPCLKSNTLYAEPNSKNFHFIPVDTDNGQIYIPETKLDENLFIEEGVYTAQDWSSKVSIINTSDRPRKFVVHQLARTQSLENFHECHFNLSNNLYQQTHDNFELHIQTDHLNEEERKPLIKLCQNFESLFFKDGQNLTFTNQTKHKIITKDEVPCYTKSYRYPYIHKTEIQEQIQNLLNQKIIRPSYSPWSSPIWIVPKKLDSSGRQKWRMVIDYRKLNEKTIDDRYPLPNITEILDKLGRSMYFTSLDLASGFHQIEIDPKDIQKTAFSVDNGHYEFVRMPFGLKNAPATFQRVMDNILKDYIGKICLVYLDDIVVYSTSLQEHIENLSKVFKRLQNANLKLQIDKCQFLRKEIEFLGHVVSQDGIRPNPKKISAIKNYPIPKTQKQIKQFLGLLGYYRKFIHNFSKITKPMTKLLKKDADVSNPPQEFIDSFEKCKTLLVNDPILQYPDFSKPFHLTTDASNFAIGAVLSQGPLGQDKPVCFASRTLNQSECNYSTIEKELLAIVWACKYFRPYLYGRKFNLLSDHEPLKSVHHMKNTNNKLTRWKLQLEEFEYTPLFIKGKNNVVADALSRIPEIHISESINATVHSADSDISNLIPISDSPINTHNSQIIILKRNEQSNLPEHISEYLFDKTKRRHTFYYNNYDRNLLINIIKQYINPTMKHAIYCPDDKTFLHIQDIIKTLFIRLHGKLVRCTKLLEDIIPIELQRDKMKTTHENNNHRGIIETLNRLQDEYYFPNMKSKITEIINNCEICQICKYDRNPPKYVFQQTETAKHPNDIIHADLLNLENQWFLTIIDKYSRYAQLYPVSSKNAIDIVKSFSHHFSVHGKPKKLVTDTGGEFSNALLADYLKKLGIQNHYTSSGNHTSNSPIERFHLSLLEHYRIQKTLKPKENILDNVRESLYFYNNAIHTTTKFKPFELYFGRPNDFLETLDDHKEHEYYE